MEEIVTVMRQAGEYPAGLRLRGLIATAQQNGGILSIFWDVGGDEIDPGSGELDCGTLVYCSAGGTGRFLAVAGSGASRDTAAPFPECCDPDGDGLGSLTSTQLFAGSQGGALMELYHGATTDQIRAGDVLIERATVHGAAAQFAASVGFVFSTVPVLAAYNDGQGNSATFTYPRAMTMCVPGQVFDPASSCPLPVRAGPDGDVVVTLTFWRPQRRRVEGEPGEGKWMDVGNLVYDTSVQLVGPNAPGGNCPTSSFSGMDPNLTSVPSSPRPPAMGGARLADLSGDRPSNPANTFIYTLNLTDCLASKGLSFPSSEPVSGQFSASAEHESGGYPDDGLRCLVHPRALAREVSSPPLSRQPPPLPERGAHEKGRQAPPPSSDVSIKSAPLAMLACPEKRG